VTSSEEQRVERFARRLKLETERARREVERRMAAQLPDSVKSRKAHYIIDNSGSLDATQAQVERVYRLLKAEAEGREAAQNPVNSE
jgi:dephospho-CoA kinase